MMLLELDAISSAMCFRSLVGDVARGLLNGRVSGEPGSINYDHIHFLELFRALTEARNVKNAAEEEMLIEADAALAAEMVLVTLPLPLPLSLPLPMPLLPLER